MKAIALWQPWATLVAKGAKRVETRHWPPPTAVVGTRIAIHATLTKHHLVLCEEEPFNEYVTRDNCPLGCVLATVVLDRVSRITKQAGLTLHDRNWHEFAFGDYAPGRYAWVLRDVEQLPVPIPWKGTQGFFDVPDTELRQERLL